LAFDRDATLKKAEKLLRQGRLDAAIAEYERVLDVQPGDWNTANTLGDLYGRAGQPDQAIAQYSRIADHFTREGFYPRAAALYKKILKINRDEETAQLQLAEVSARQGLVADARALLQAVAARRRMRSDRRGEAEIVIRLGTLDPSDVEARFAAARALEAAGRGDEAAERYRTLHADLTEKGRTERALEALRELSRLGPLDAGARASLARAAFEAGDLARARDLLDRDAAGRDPALLMELVRRHLEAGDAAAVRALVSDALAADARWREDLLACARAAPAAPGAAAFACVEAVADGLVKAGEFREAAAVLGDFAGRAAGHIDSLLKLVEVCVDGGLESEMYAAQARLTDAYLAAGQAAEARVIAEDLVAREPWEQAHIDRFRRALVLLRVSDPDAEIAERLSGQSPFTATDRFMAAPDAAAVTAAPEDPSDPGQPASEEELVAAEAPPHLPVETRATSPAENGEPPPPVESVPAGGTADELDLTDALGSLDLGPAAGSRAESPDAESLEDAFEALREEAQASADYSAQHMTLARTYLEMGLTDQAMASLETAARSPRQRFEAASRLGRLLLERGDVARALEWLERAAEAPPPSVEEGRALMYDFGVALDSAGETARALAVFLELQADAGDYRDAPARIDRLARAQTGG